MGELVGGGSVSNHSPQCDRPPSAPFPCRNTRVQASFSDAFMFLNIKTNDGMTLDE